jgi:hypothetical protein
MEILIGIAHILGSVVVYLIFGYVLMLFNAWEQEKTTKQMANEVSVTSGIKISASDLNKEEHAQTLMEFYTEKFNSELFKNKMSDFFGVIRMLWGWQAIIVQVLILISVFWYTVADNIDNAVYAWLIVGFSVVSWLVNIFITTTSKILTGRSPGQAKAARKVVADWHQNHNKSLDVTTE